MSYSFVPDSIRYSTWATHTEREGALFPSLGWLLRWDCATCELTDNYENIEREIYFIIPKIYLGKPDIHEYMPLSLITSLYCRQGPSRTIYSIWFRVYLATPSPIFYSVSSLCSSGYCFGLLAEKYWHGLYLNECGQARAPNDQWKVIVQKLWIAASPPQCTSFKSIKKQYTYSSTTINSSCHPLELLWLQVFTS